MLLADQECCFDFINEAVHEKKRHRREESLKIYQVSDGAAAAAVSGLLLFKKIKAAESLVSSRRRYRFSVPACYYKRRLCVFEV